MVTSRAGQVDLGPVLGRGAVPADPDAVESDREVLRLEGGVGGADRAQDPAPVGVLAVDGALEQVAAGHRPGDRHRVVDRGRAGDGHRDALASRPRRRRPAAGPGRRRPARPRRAARRRRARPRPRRTPAAARCRWWTCSRRSRPGRTSCWSPAAARRPAGRPGRSASVVRTTSIVASPGASMPAPLAIPPTRKPPAPTATDCFGTESVVMIARAASSAPETASSGTAASTPASSRSIGSRSPIRPVEQTATSPADSSSAIATHSAVAWVSWKPGRAGAGVGAAGVQDDGVDPAVPHHLLRSRRPARP